ncbi:MAG: methylated-DNA--[protein]-cysteine S-methyltransferase [Sarcina sp.]
MNVAIYKTIIGNLKIVADEKNLYEVNFFYDEFDKSKQNENEITKRTIKQIREYLEGERKSFDLPIHIEGTDFQKLVWNALIKIPYGEIRSYKDIAIEIGKEKAVRAVGNANNKNKIIIIIPCHRVIGSSGKLVGYAGGLDNKKKLLEIEKIFIKE